MFCFLNIILEEFVNNHILIEVILNMREYKNPPPPPDQKIVFEVQLNRIKDFVWSKG